jgi:hypothetical protein
MPPSKKKRSRHVEFDEYVPPDTLHVEEPVVLQERHTHYELHGRVVHSLLTVPASPPSTDLASDDFNFASDDLDRAIEEYPPSTAVEEIEEDHEIDNCELEALGLEMLGRTDGRKKRRRTQAVRSLIPIVYLSLTFNRTIHFFCGFHTLTHMLMNF